MTLPRCSLGEAARFFLLNSKQSRVGEEENHGKEEKQQEKIWEEQQETSQNEERPGNIISGGLR